MYNHELLNKIIENCGIEKSITFCEVAATMYDIKYNAAKTKDTLIEFDYEREWWNDAYVQLKKDITI